MNRLQKRLIFIYLPLTVVLLVIDHLYPGTSVVRWCKLSLLVPLLIIAEKVRKTHPEQRVLTLALFLAVMGDAFFYVYLIFLNPDSIVAILGAACFLSAYLCLISVFLKRPRFDIKEFMLLLPVFSIILAIFIKCHHLTGAALGCEVVAFVLILGFMTWRSACTFLENYYTFKTSLLMAAAGHLLLISDLAVGVAVYCPVIPGQFSPLLENIIWGAFIPGWTIIVIIIAEKNLYK